ncbi:MAG: YbaB/EbfC family nucleoid-associated protein [Vampirovibrionales bacterium]|nr:YbaB/EbfC family nucleoid-associated protein [Vampirovibrionales bacterium]
MFDLGKMMKQAQKLQSEMGSVKEEIEKLQVCGEAGGGAVKVSCNGRFEFTNISISPDVLADATLLEDLLLTALNDASGKIHEETSARMSKLTSMLPPGMKLPGM